MPLQASNKLGRYQILAPLGEGVIRAHDTQLERNVAIKVAPRAGSLRTKANALDAAHQKSITHRGDGKETAAA
jgi:hypothetical protein